MEDDTLTSVNSKHSKSERRSITPRRRSINARRRSAQNDSVLDGARARNSVLAVNVRASHESVNGQHMDDEQIQNEVTNSLDKIHEDDICPVCQNLICIPVTTRCGHTLCQTCLRTWAELSLTTPLSLISVEDPTFDLDAESTMLEARCPMCRANTSATPDEGRANQLRSRYPTTYAERLAEENIEVVRDENVQPMTIYIGNRHELKQPPDDSQNQHQWTFFIKPSRTDIIEEIHVWLHESFRPNHIVRARSPYEIRRVGWGVFTVVAGVMLKPGYSWISSDAEDSPDGANRGMLRLDWMLDFSSFDGTGAMALRKLKVKNDRGWYGIDREAARDAAAHARMLAQYDRDQRWMSADG